MMHTACIMLKGANGNLTVTSKLKGVVIVPNCVLKGSWFEKESGSIRKKLNVKCSLSVI